VGLVALGPWVFKFWLGKEFADTSRVMFACFAFFFTAHVWRHLNHALMIGTGQVVRLAKVQFLETAILAVAAWFALNYGGLGAMLLAMGATIFGVTGWTLPRMVGRELREESEVAGEIVDRRISMARG
jgi:O-antigen/teichoic acid export membrane protein